jgi:hypothetical protein
MADRGAGPGTLKNAARLQKRSRTSRVDGVNQNVFIYNNNNNNNVQASVKQ